MNLITQPVGITHYLVVGAFLFVTGAVMWWNRVLRKGARWPE